MRYFLLLLALAGFAPVRPARAADEMVKITITATVPKDTPADSKIYLAGNLDAVGSWKADGVEMKKLDSGDYQVELKLPKDETLEYKLNRGNWETVEKAANGDEIANRTLTSDKDKEEKITVGTWRKDAAPSAPSNQEKKSTATGDIHYHGEFASKILGNERQLIVWLPPGYEDEKDRRYPVLYMHDGQNVFDVATSFAGEWRADETAAKLIADKKIEPIIMVGIENAGSKRMSEYTPTVDPTLNQGGHAEDYAKFLIEEVKPFIDHRYRTQSDREHTAVAGSSLGGLVSLYLIEKHGDVFSKCAAISPTLNWDNRQLLHQIEADKSWTTRGPLIIWLDMGTAEGTGDDPARSVDAARAMADVLRKTGLVENKEFAFKEFNGAAHNEAAWAARFDQVLMFLFSPPG